MSQTPGIPRFEIHTHPSGSVFLGAGSNVNQPRGLAFDATGNLYDANAGDNRILKFTPTPAGSVFANTGLSNPGGLAFDAAGNLFAANLNNNTIRKFSPAGADLGIFAGTNLNQPFGLAFDSDGNLFVSNHGDNTIAKFTSGGIGSIFASSGLNGPSGLAFDSAGFLYAGQSGRRWTRLQHDRKIHPRRPRLGLCQQLIVHPGVSRFTDETGVPLPLAKPSPRAFDMGDAGGGRWLAARLPPPFFLFLLILILCLTFLCATGRKIKRKRKRKRKKKHTHPSSPCTHHPSPDSSLSAPRSPWLPRPPRRASLLGDRRPISIPPEARPATLDVSTNGTLVGAFNSASATP